MDHEPEQVFYKLSELSEMLGVENSVLRFWEKEFAQIKPLKVGPRKRLYRRKDLETFEEIKRLLYDERFTIAGAQKRLNSADSRQRRLFEDDEDKLATALASPAEGDSSDRARLAEARARLAETKKALLEIRGLLSAPKEPDKVLRLRPVRPKKKSAAPATARRKAAAKKTAANKNKGASE